MPPKLRVDRAGRAKKGQADSQLGKALRAEVFFCRALGKKAISPESVAEIYQKGLSLLCCRKLGENPYIRFNPKLFHKVSNHEQV